jgi:hypothetical protein
MNDAKYIGLDVHQATISVAVTVQVKKGPKTTFPVSTTNRALGLISPSGLADTSTA